MPGPDLMLRVPQVLGFFNDELVGSPQKEEVASPFPPPFCIYSSPPRSPSRAQNIPSKWAKIREIGTGSFGTVYEAVNLDDGSFIAVKIIHGETITAKTQKETEVLSYLKHPNVVRYYGTGQENGHLCIFMELIPNSLQSIFKDSQFFGETLISTYTRQILQGLEYLHKKKIIHRDIKCANILVDKDGQVKLADFGLAKEVGATSSKGSPYFMAPEILRPDKTGEKGYGLPVDIWSLGCTVLEMAAGKPPWSGSAGYSWVFRIFKGELPPIPPHLSPACVDFIRRCLSFKAEDRPTASELLRHPFVANADSPPAIVSLLAAPDEGKVIGRAKEENPALSLDHSCRLVDMFRSPSRPLCPFRKLDSQKKGYLGPHEFATLLRTKCQMQITSSDANELFFKMDSDHDGLLTEEEYNKNFPLCIEALEKVAIGAT